MAEFNQRAYELFGRPLVQAMSNEYAAKLSRAFHPLRFQRWAFSDLNPSLWWLGPTAEAVKAQRQALDADHPARKLESAVSEVTNASLDCYRGLRDAVAEAAFFQIYGNAFAMYLGDDHGAETAAMPSNPRELSVVKKALASIDKGGYPEALARVAFLLAHKDEPLPLSRLQLAQELIEEYAELLPELAPAETRRIEGEQELIARYAPERAVATLPALLADADDRGRLLTLLDSVLADKRVQRIEPSAEQKTMLARIRAALRAADHQRVAARHGNGSRKVARVEGRGNKNLARGRAASNHSRRKAVTQ
jgi:hypothetical protein